MSITANATLVSLRRGRVALGLIVRLAPSVEIAGIAKASGHDFLFIDMQHGGMSIESTIAACHGALATGVTPLVRVPGHEAFHAGRVLDNGAMGIIVPDVETADEARQAVLNCRFPPLGRRSVAAVYPQLGYGAYSTAEATRILNEQTVLVVMIESGRGIDNVEAIAAVPGIDVVHVGSNDLLNQMGISGEAGKERHLVLCAKVRDACRANGRFFGVGGVRSPEAQSEFIRMGARMLTTNSDLAFLLAAAAERARVLRAAEAEALGSSDA